MGLVNQRRESRTLHCTPCLGALEQVVAFLREQCCAGVHAGVQSVRDERAG